MRRTSQSSLDAVTATFEPVLRAAGEALGGDQ